MLFIFNFIRTAQVAVISVVFLYLTIVFCFPAWCWYDMQRQAAGRHDVIRCRKSEEQQEKKDHWASFLFDRIYKPLILGSSSLRICAHAFIWICALALVAAGSYGLTERKVGLGLEVRKTYPIFVKYKRHFNESKNCFLSFIYCRISFPLTTKPVCGLIIMAKSLALGS